jgi:hypothetical protein
MSPRRNRADLLLPIVCRCCITTRCRRRGLRPGSMLRFLPASDLERSEDKDPTHTIARISFSDLEDDEAILSDVVIFASISICH